MDRWAARSAQRQESTSLINRRSSLPRPPSMWSAHQSTLEPVHTSARALPPSDLIGRQGPDTCYPPATAPSDPRTWRHRASAALAFTRARRSAADGSAGKDVTTVRPRPRVHARRYEALDAPATARASGGCQRHRAGTPHRTPARQGGTGLPVPNTCEQGRSISW